MEPFMRDVLFYALDISGKKDKNIVITKEMTEQYARNIMSSGRYEKV